VHEPAARPAPHRVTGTDHGADRTAPQPVLTYLSILDRLNLPPEHYEIMNMQVGRVETAPAPAAESQGPAAERQSQRAGRRLYIPTIVIAGLAAWLGYRGWTALSQAGVARSFDAGRYQLAGPVVLGFVLARTVGIFGFHLTFSSGLAWTC